MTIDSRDLNELDPFTLKYPRLPVAPDPALVQTRVREVRAVQTDVPPDAPPRRWFKYMEDDGGCHAVIAGYGFPPGVAYCVVHRRKDCFCVKAVTDYGFLEHEPEAGLLPLGE